jgi:hypothetical protein
MVALGTAAALATAFVTEGRANSVPHIVEPNYSACFELMWHGNNNNTMWYVPSSNNNDSTTAPNFDEASGRFVFALKDSRLVPDEKKTDLSM